MNNLIYCAKCKQLTCEEHSDGHVEHIADLARFHGRQVKDKDCDECLQLKNINLLYIEFWGDDAIEELVCVKHIREIAEFYGPMNNHPLIKNAYQTAPKTDVPQVCKQCKEPQWNGWRKDKLISNTANGQAVF